MMPKLTEIFIVESFSFSTPEQALADAENLQAKCAAFVSSMKDRKSKRDAMEVQGSIDYVVEDIKDIIELRKNTKPGPSQDYFNKRLEGALKELEKYEAMIKV